MSKEPQEGGYIGQAWLVILLALLYGGALAGVQTTLGPMIAENKMNETYNRIPDLVPGTDRDKTKEVNQADQLAVKGVIDGKEQRVYAAVDAEGAHKGWVLPASGLGFADRIELLIGLDAEVSTISGLYVLDQKETPGLGNFITSDELFLNQFAGKSADEHERLKVVKAQPEPGSNQIEALSGATISSESVADIVNKAIANYKEPIHQLRLAPASTPGGTPRGRGG